MVPPNVLLIVLDSARARNCSLYGRDNETTPFLERFADEAAVFEQARAPSIHSISSHVSLFTGYHVEEHNVTEHKSFVEPDATVWHRLGADHGYETGLFTANVIVSQTSNLADSFDTCVGPRRANFRLFERGLAPLDVQGDLTGAEYLREALAHDAPVRSVLNGVYKKLEPRGGSQDPDEEGADVYVDEFLDWIDAQSGPWAACLNLMDTHTPFVPDAEYDRWSDDEAHEALERVEGDDGPDPFTDEFWDALAALAGERRPGWVLELRDRVQQLRRRLAGGLAGVERRFQRVGVESGLVEIDAREVGATVVEHRQAPDERGRLDQHLIPRVEERRGDGVQCVRRPVRDDQLVPCGVDPAVVLPGQQPVV